MISIKEKRNKVIIVQRPIGTKPPLRRDDAVGLCRELCQDVLEQKITGKVYTKSMSQQTSYTYYACCAKMRIVTIVVCCVMLSYPYSAEVRQLAIVVGVLGCTSFRLG